MSAAAMSEGPTVAAVAPQDQTRNENRHADSPADSLDGQDRKEFATLQALLALKGYALHGRSTGDYVVTRWNLDRALPDLAAVCSFAERVGAAS